MIKSTIFVVTIQISLLSITAIAAPRVIATITPAQALVAEVMTGVGKPTLLVPGGASPHVYALRPSDAQALAAAQVVVLIDPSFETFLVKPLAALASRARVVHLADIPGVRKYPARGPWGVDRQTGAAFNDEGKNHTHDKGYTHNRANTFDPHLWLDPDNARHIVIAIAVVLAEVDPANAAIYHRNAETVRRNLIDLDETLRRELTPVAQQPFIVFHDAYQYLEARYGLNVVGTVTVAPERVPGARHLAELRERIQTLGVVCIFHEPQFPPKLIETIIAGTGVRVGILDPLGQAGSQYAAMMQANAHALQACLTPRIGTP